MGKASRSLIDRVIATRVTTSLDREVWTTRLAFVRLAWKELLGAAAIVVGAGLLVLLLPLGDSAVRHVVAGGLFASAFWIVYSVTALRTYNVTVGSWAESWTCGVLRQRSLGWAVQDDLFLGHSNIDHVAVTQDEVLVVESKFRGYSKRPDRQRHDRDVEQVRRGAQRARRDLAGHGLEVVRVVSVLVVWGPGASVLPSLTGSDQVQVVAGVDFTAWCRQRSNKRLVSLTQRRTIAKALAERRRKHDVWRTRQPV